MPDTVTWVVDERAAELLIEIERDLLGDQVRTTTVLQKCVVLGGRAGSEKLRAWASKELNGYSDDDDVPNYRKIGAVIQIDALVGNGWIKGHTISSTQLPKMARDAGVDENLTMKQGIGEIEALANGSDDAVKLTTPGAPIIAQEMDRESGRYPFQQTQSVYWSTTRWTIRGIIEGVRTALAEMVSELTANTPKGESVPSSEVVDRAVTVVLTGERASVSLGSVNSSSGDVVHLSGEVGTVKMGDTFSNISNSNIINRSLVSNVLNNLDDSGEGESAEAIRQLAELVERSGDTDAGEVFDNFSEELNKPEPRKGILRASWEQIKVLVPLAGSSATIATGIANLIS